MVNTVVNGCVAGRREGRGDGAARTSLGLACCCSRVPTSVDISMFIPFPLGLRKTPWLKHETRSQRSSRLAVLPNSIHTVKCGASVMALHWCWHTVQQRTVHTQCDRNKGRQEVQSHAHQTGGPSHSCTYQYSKRKERETNRSTQYRHSPHIRGCAFQCSDTATEGGLTIPCIAATHHTEENANFKAPAKGGSTTL